MTRVLETAGGYAFKRWLQSKVRTGTRVPVFPQSAEEVAPYQKIVRKIFESAVGPPPAYAPLDAEIHRVHERDGYRIEAVSLSTFHGLRMTGTAFVPKTDRPVPGVLAVHGHARPPRGEETLQRRCISLAKLGYFVLAFDVMGAGERSVELPGSRHGRHDGAAFWTLGTSLFSIQIHENYRACDYLVSRPEVDPDRLAITGESGGGFQSFYSGAWDERFRVVVPVCGCSANHKTITAGNCVCAIPFGLARELEQFDLLGLMAPRALLVMNASGDALETFSFPDAQETTERASHLWDFLGESEKVLYRTLPEQHGYPRSAREACLGWFHRWLKDGTGHEPIEEPEVELEEYADLSCYPGASCSHVMTEHAYFSQERDRAITEGNRLSQERVADLFRLPETIGPLWTEHIGRIRNTDNLIDPALSALVLGQIFHGDGGLLMPAFACWPDYECVAEEILIVIGDTKVDALRSPIAQKALSSGTAVWAIDLPDLGEAEVHSGLTAPAEPTDEQRWLSRITAMSACHALGFSLASVWLGALQCLIDLAHERGQSVYVCACDGPATAVLAGSSCLRDVRHIITCRPVVSYATHDVFQNVPIESLLPNALTVGDVSELAAFRAPEPLTVVMPLAMDGCELAAEHHAGLFRPIHARYEAEGARNAFRVVFAAESDDLSVWP